MGLHRRDLASGWCLCPPAGEHLCSLLIATGYVVYAINPMQASRYRERHSTSGAKSDPGDAHVLAEIVRTDRAHHRPVAGDSQQAEVVKTLARTHQSMIWTRQRQTNQLRSLLREFHPAALEAFGDDLSGRDALAVLPLASTPTAGRALTRSKIAAALRRAGRQRNIEPTAVRIVEALRSDQLGLPAALSAAYGASVRSLIAVITTMVEQIAMLEAEVNRCFGQHPDAEIITSQPGLGVVLGARVLAEFGDDKSASSTPKPAATTPAPAPSPRPPAPKRSCWPATPGTSGWPTPCTSKPLPPSPPPPAHEPSTTATAPTARPTTKHYAHCPTDSSASSTAAYATARSTKKPPAGHTAHKRQLDKLAPWDI